MTETVSVPAGSTLRIRIDGEPRDKMLAAFAKTYGPGVMDAPDFSLSLASYTFDFDATISVAVQLVSKEEK